MKTLNESIAEYNDGKLKLDSLKTIKKEARANAVLLKDIKDALMNVYRQKGIDIARDILLYFKIQGVDDLSERNYPLFLEMCEKELVN